MKNYKGEIARLQEQAHARAALPAECTCVTRQHQEVVGTVAFLDGVPHENLQPTPEQEKIFESWRACQRDHSGEGVSLTIIPPLSDEMKQKLGLL
jgi:hypothetical protein